jgi:hypothetical protein
MREPVGERVRKHKLGLATRLDELLAVQAAQVEQSERVEKQLAELVACMEKQESLRRRNSARSRNR